MSIKKIHLHIAFVLIAALLAGCGSSNKFASSFGKRRYMKGFYHNTPSGTVTAKTGERKQAVSYNAMPVKKPATLAITQAHILHVKAVKMPLASNASHKTSAKTSTNASVNRFIPALAKPPGGQPDYVAPNRGMSDWAQALLIALFTLILTGALLFMLFAIAAHAPPFAIVALAVFVVAAIVAIVLIASMPTNSTRSYQAVNNAVPVVSLFLDLFMAIISAAH